VYGSRRRLDWSLSRRKSTIGLVKDDGSARLEPDPLPRGAISWVLPSVMTANWGRLPQYQWQCAVLPPLSRAGRTARVRLQAKARSSSSPARRPGHESGTRFSWGPPLSAGQNNSRRDPPGSPWAVSGWHRPGCCGGRGRSPDAQPRHPMGKDALNGADGVRVGHLAKEQGRTRSSSRGSGRGHRRHVWRQESSNSVRGMSLMSWKIR